MSTPTTTAARNAVAAVFFLNGLLFASLVSRVPDLRSGLELSNGGLGLLLLMIAVGSLVSLPLTGALVARVGSATVVVGASVSSAVGQTLAAVGTDVGGGVPLVALGLVLYGVGTGSWDVAMNIEGAEVERRLGRTIMPRFHAGFSLGTVAGALVAVPVVAAGVQLWGHLPVVAWLALGAVVVAVRAFFAVEPVEEGATSAARAWLEPRVWLIGVVVMAFAITEGSANDWLALALVDGHDTAHWVGVAGFATFVTAMTVGRVLGTSLIDRFGRVATLRLTVVLGLAGLLLLVFGSGPVVPPAIILWGLGASLGFPVGMSAAADDPRRAAARVSVVATIGYAAFLAGPPLLGALGDGSGNRQLLVPLRRNTGRYARPHRSQRRLPRPQRWHAIPRDGDLGRPGSGHPRGRVRSTSPTPRADSRCSSRTTPTTRSSIGTSHSTSPPGVRASTG